MPLFLSSLCLCLATRLVQVHTYIRSKLCLFITYRLLSHVVRFVVASLTLSVTSIVYRIPAFSLARNACAFYSALPTLLAVLFVLVLQCQHRYPPAFMHVHTHRSLSALA